MKHTGLVWVVYSEDWWQIQVSPRPSTMVRNHGLSLTKVPAALSSRRNPLGVFVRLSLGFRARGDGTRSVRTQRASAESKSVRVRYPFTEPEVAPLIMKRWAMK